MSAKILTVASERLDQGKLERAARALEAGQVAVLPTETNYILAARPGDKQAIERIRRIRGCENGKMFSLFLASFASMGQYAVIDNRAFRLIKDIEHGGYTFILPATKEVPRAFAHKKRKTIGLRLPDHPAYLAFLAGIDGPLAGCSLQADGASLADLDGRVPWLAKLADVIIDAGALRGGETTILDLADAAAPDVLRAGVGDVAFLHA